MNRSTHKIQPITTGHYQKRVAAFRFLGGVAALVPMVALLHKWMQDCTITVLPVALAVVTLCGALMRLIDFKKQVDPADITPSQSIFNRLGALDPQYEYDRNIKWLKVRWLVFVGVISILFIVIDFMFMADLCESQYSYKQLMCSDVAAPARPEAS